MILRQLSRICSSLFIADKRPFIILYAKEINFTIRLLAIMRNKRRIHQSETQNNVKNDQWNFPNSYILAIINWFININWHYTANWHLFYFITERYILIVHISTPILFSLQHKITCLWTNIMPLYFRHTTFHWFNQLRLTQWPCTPDLPGRNGRT